MSIGTGELFMIIIAFAFGLWLFYAILKAAVSAGNKEMLQQMTFQNLLKVKELKDAGLTEEELNDAKNKAFRNGV